MKKLVRVREPMRLSLDELRRQREAVRKHLAWLDEVIERRTTAPDATSAEKTPGAARDDADPPASRSEADPPETRAPEAHGAEAESDPGQAFESASQDERQRRADQTRRAKAGCLIAFALAIAGFLFLLFGLPYLM